MPRNGMKNNAWYHRIIPAIIRYLIILATQCRLLWLHLVKNYVSVPRHTHTHREKDSAESTKFSATKCFSLGQTNSFVNRTNWFAFLRCISQNFVQSIKKCRVQTRICSIELNEFHGARVQAQHDVCKSQSVRKSQLLCRISSRNDIGAE